MKLILVLLIFIASTQATKWTSIRPLVPHNFESSKRINAVTSGRIVSGNEATPGQFPYQVGIILDGVGLCGASLISETIVLSAGHCLDGFITIEVHIGAHFLYEYDESGRVITISRDFHAHENYDLFTITNDVGYVRLSEPVTLTPTIQLIRLPSRSQELETFEGLPAIVSGWGVYNSSNPGPSPVLKYAELKVLTNEECAPIFPEGFIVDSMLCADDVSGNACNSDSGGPIVITESDGIATLIGVVSFGTGLECENGDPGGYSRITSFLDWIETNTGVIIRP